jgi:hypothetical protein
MLSVSCLFHVTLRTAVHPHCGSAVMNAAYYREQAERARRLARGLPPSEKARGELEDLARRYDETAEDIAKGVELRHPELMPRSRR